MNDKNSELSIEISYKKEKITKSINEIKTLEELKEKIIKEFNIKNDLKKYITFTYLDEQNDINIIENFENIFKISKEITPEKHLSKINLEICPYESEIINNKNI